MGCSSSNTREFKEARVLMIGPKNSGKTTILYMLKLKQLVQTIPTLGINVETVPGARGLHYTVTDVGGDARLRRNWNQHYPRNEAVILVVDSSSIEQVREAKELFSELNDKHLRGLPLLVLANKKDVPGAIAPSQIQEELHLKAIIDRTWALDAVSGTSGAGLDVVLGDLSRMISNTRSKKENAKKDKSVDKMIV